MEVGDMIMWQQPDRKDIGIVLEITADALAGSKALVLWHDEKIQWIACGVCGVINENRYNGWATILER